ncbi:MAG: alpha/beta fold hydrolase [Acidimicrobiales bacterium]
MIRVGVPDGRIAAWERGSGPPVVLVHGGTGTAAHDWAPIVPRLARRFRTIALDLRGHGQSPGAPDGIGMTRFGLDVVHVMRYLGVPAAVLVGFSVGGNTLLKLVARQPWIARAVVTIGSSAQGDGERVHQILSGPWPADLVAIDHAAGDGPDYWRALRRALAEDWAANLDLAPSELQSIDCPVLVCHGDRDRVQSLDEALYLYRRLPRAELFVVPQAGHSAQLDQPDLFGAALERFIDRTLRLSSSGSAPWTSP